MRDSKREILDFWFVETDPSLWFQKNPEFDATLRERFRVIYDMAVDGICNAWSDTADGTLALVLVLDQFPRNMFRGQAKAFDTDSKALLFSKHAIHKGFDQVLPPEKKRFIYMPFMHSEDMKEQERSVELFNAMKDMDPLSYQYAVKHKDVIEKYGRFPGRNDALGRESTSDEQEYLNNGGGF